MQKIFRFSLFIHVLIQGLKLIQNDEDGAAVKLNHTGEENHQVTVGLKLRLGALITKLNKIFTNHYKTLENIDIKSFVPPPLHLLRLSRKLP